MLYDGFPLLGVPFELRGFFIGDAGGAADEDDAVLAAFSHLDEAENENVGVSADEAFNGEVSELSLGMCGYFVVFGFDEMEDDVRGEAILPLFIAEPFSACFVGAADNAGFVADCAEGAGVGWELLFCGDGGGAI